MDERSGTGLPASIEAAWGLRVRPQKGPKPGLSLDRIVAAAVRVAGSDGLAAVSMSRVATELGAAAMSLYRYVAAKDELLALMMDAAIGTPPGPPDPDEDWRSGLSRWAWAVRAAYRQHPWVLRIPISTPPITPNQIGWLEHGLTCLRDTGLTEVEKLSVMLLLSGYVRNEAMLTDDVEGAARAAGITMDESMLGYSRLLARVADAERFPALHRALASGALDQADPPETEFVFGLDRVLDGIDVLVRARS
jgi:AcrR family transcriptional regulator